MNPIQEFNDEAARIAAEGLSVQFGTSRSAAHKAIAEVRFGRKSDEDQTHLRERAEQYRAVVIAEYDDVSGLHVIGGNLGWRIEDVKHIEVEIDQEYRLFWVSINGCGFAYESEMMAEEDYAMIFAEPVVHLRGVADDEGILALRERVGRID